ncbi:MAG TPA: DUF481 domain-containing protein [Lysobacter sp.]|nr:DUF481 domain-containing protein [Lysobacter sp.]
MHKFLLAGALFAAAVPATAFAHESLAPANWSGTGELGLALSKGNTDSQTLIGKLGVAKEEALWKHEAGLAFLYGKQNGLESAYRYEGFGKTNHQISERSYMSGSARIERDHHAAYEYQSTAAAGYGYKAIATEASHLNFEIGSGYRWAKQQGIRVHEDGAVLRGHMDFNHQFNASTSLYDTLLVEAGRDNTFARNELGLKVKMSDALALKAGVEVRHNTDVLPDTRKTDTLTTVNIAYGF